ncbi:MAG: SHOCT domain-containing protein [Burkholderiaceae bacterium]|nr:SHOCT domain-containing protein [Burkholderiaceae bacterium]
MCNDFEGYGYGFGWHWLGWLTMPLFWLLLVVLLVAVVRYLRRGDDSSKVPKSESLPTALAILEERYARGEIGREEYVQKRDDLKRS